MKKHEFKVTDSAGLWGSIRMEGKTRKIAANRARVWLLYNEVESKGSLLFKFELSKVT